MTTATPTVATADAAPAAPGPGVPLYRMPLVWVAALVPAAFLFYLFFLTPPL